MPLLRPSHHSWLEDLYRERTLIPYKAGEQIRLKTRELLVVYRGIVQLLTLDPSGDEALLGLLGPMMPLGLPLTLLEAYQGVALTNCDLLRVSWDDLQQSPQLAQEMNLQMARRLQQTEALLALVGKRHINDRLRGFLLLLCHDFGAPTADGVRLEIRLTHQQIANALGTTRVTVTRMLGELREQGLVTVDQGRFLCLTKALIPVNSN